MAAGMVSSSIIRPAMALWVMILAGCAVGPDFQRPEAPTALAVLPASEPLSTPLIAFDNAPVDPRWWTSFQNPTLDALVTESLRDSPTFAAARETLAQAQDALRAGAGVYFPTVSADLGAVRERYAPVKVGQSAPSNVFNVYTASGAVGYLLDLFGGSRRAVEGLQAAADAQRFGVGIAYLSLTGNVVNTAIARSSYRAQTTTLRAMLHGAETVLALREAQLKSGVGADADVLSSEASVAGLKGALAIMQLHAEQADHLQAALLGRLPVTADLVDIDLHALGLPASMPTVLPSTLVRQRPDVLVAEARLHQASAEIGVATANLFPSITLSGNVGAAADRWSALGGASGRFWSAGADLSVPLFQGGKLWFGRKAAIDAFGVAQHNYRQVVLLAFQQVADVLQSVSRDSEALMASERALGDAQGVYAITKANHAAGLADGTTLMAAEIARGSAQLARDGAYAVVLQDAVALYVALGGGWVPGVGESTPDLTDGGR